MEYHSTFILHIVMVLGASKMLLMVTCVSTPAFMITLLMGSVIAPHKVG